MIDREAKAALFDGFARVGRALASGRRVELLDLLAQGRRSVEEAAEAADMSVANTSHHLQTLREAGLVTARREGNRVIHELASAEVLLLLNLLREVAHDHSAEVRASAEAYLGGPVEPLTGDELLELLRRDQDVVVVDVRPENEYRASHIPGARSIPVDELRARLDEIPDRAEVVAYCRGRFCAYAHAAVRILEAAGRTARRLEDGLPEWRLAGLPVEEG